MDFIYNLFIPKALVNFNYLNLIYEIDLMINDLIIEQEKPVLKTATERFTFDKVVIACGAFSKKLTDKLDEKIPLETERGYHVHFKGHDHLLSRPVIFLNRGFGITPMEQGLRVVGTVEFGGLDNPPSKKRFLNLVYNARCPNFKLYDTI